MVLSIISPFIGLSLSSYYSVEYHKDELKAPYLYGQIINFYIISGVVIGLILLLIQGYIIDLTQIEPQWLWMAYFSAILTAIVGLHLANLRIQEKAKNFGVFNLLQSIVLVGLTLLFVVILLQGAKGRVWSLTLTKFIFGIVAIYYAIKFVNNIYLPNWNVIKPMLLFGMPLLPHTISLWIKSGYEKILITQHLGLSDNGVYSFALNLGFILALLSTSFFSAFSPYVYKKLNQSTKDKINEEKIKIIKLTYLFLGVYIIVGFLLLIVSIIGINIFFIDKYGGAVKLLPWIFGYHFFNTVYIAFSSYIFFSKNTKFLGVITVLSAVVQILLLNLFINIYGMIGVVISSLFVSILTVILTAYYSNKVYYMPWFSKDLFKK